MSGSNLSPLDEVAERVCVGYVGPSSEFFCEDGVPFLRTGNVGTKKLHLHDIKRVTPEFHSKQKKSTLKAGDVLVTRVVSDELKAAIVPPELAGGNCGNIIVVRPGKRLDSNYLMHLLSAPDSQKTLLGRQVGSAQSVINTAVLKSWQILVLDLEEQRRIAAILDQAETLRTQRRQALAHLDTLTQSLFLDMFGDPVSNPKGFETCLLGDIIEFLGGSQPAKEHFTFEPSPDSIRLVQIRDFRTDEFKTYIPRKLAKRLFEVDDVMIGRYGPPVFQIFRGLSGSYNVALMKALPKAGVLRDFTFFLLQEPGLHGYVVDRSTRTAGQSGVNLDLLENYPAFKPPVALQQAFATRIQAIEALKATHRTALTQLDALFASLQQRAFAGEL